METEIWVALIGGAAAIVAVVIPIMLKRKPRKEKPISKLEEQALKYMKDLYNREPEAFVPANDLVKELRFDTETGDAVLSGLRTKGLLKTFKHPQVDQVLVKLTTKGLECSIE